MYQETKLTFAKVRMLFADLQWRTLNQMAAVLATKCPPEIGLRRLHSAGAANPACSWMADVLRGFRDKISHVIYSFIRDGAVAKRKIVKGLHTFTEFRFLPDGCRTSRKRYRRQAKT